jgi:hypothetical protein
MLHLVNQRYDIITTTPDRSRPSSPSLSPAVVTHTIATSSKPPRSSWDASAVDLTELSKLLAKSTSSTSSNASNNTATPPNKAAAAAAAEQQRNNKNVRPRSQLFQSSKPPSPTLSTSSAEPTFCTNSNAAAAPILLTTSQQQPRPILSHRPASTCSTPSQFIFKKPEYDERYHQTHFHRQSSSQSIQQHHNDRSSGNKDLFLAWSDLRRFFVNTQQQQGVVSPTSPTDSTHSLEDNKSTKSDTFANQFRQDIGGRYGTWGKVVK